MIKTCKGNYFHFYPKNIYFLYYISIQPLYIQMFVLKFIYVFLRHFEIVLVEIFLYFTWQPAQWGAYFRYDVNLHFILHIMNGFHHSVLTNILSVDIFRKCSKVELKNGYCTHIYYLISTNNSIDVLLLNVRLGSEYRNKCQSVFGAKFYIVNTCKSFGFEFQLCFLHKISNS